MGSCTGKTLFQCAWSLVHLLWHRLPTCLSAPAVALHRPAVGCIPIPISTSACCFSQHPTLLGSFCGNPASRRFNSKKMTLPNTWLMHRIYYSWSLMDEGTPPPRPPSAAQQAEHGAVALPDLHSHQLGAAVCWTPAPSPERREALVFIWSRARSLRSKRMRQTPLKMQ